MNWAHITATAGLLIAYIAAATPIAALTPRKWETPALFALMFGTVLPATVAATFATRTEVETGMLAGAGVTITVVLGRVWLRRPRPHATIDTRRTSRRGRHHQ
jgi:biotin transporter BioY